MADTPVGTVMFQGRMYVDLGDLVVAFQRCGDIMTARAIDQILVQMQEKPQDSIVNVVRTP